MFRIVTEQVKDPAMLLMCDDSRCSVITSMRFQADPTLNMAAVQDGFIREAISQGWMVTLGKQLCPYHLQQLVAAQQSQSRIVVPSVALN